VTLSAGLVIAIALLALSPRASSAEAGVLTTAHRVVVGRTFALPAGVTKTSFDFTIHADYPDLVVMIVPWHTALGVRALSENGLMQITGATGRTTCRRHGSLDLCTQGEEWCPLVQGRWHAVVTKTSNSAAVVRLLLVFARGVSPG
jgi:hypothetical protein